MILSLVISCIEYLSKWSRWATYISPICRLGYCRRQFHLNYFIWLISNFNLVRECIWWDKTDSLWVRCIRSLNRLSRHISTRISSRPNSEPNRPIWALPVGKLNNKSGNIYSTYCGTNHNLTTSWWLACSKCVNAWSSCFYHKSPVECWNLDCVRSGNSKTTSSNC